MDLLSKLFSFLEKFIPALLLAYANSQKKKADDARRAETKASLEVETLKVEEKSREEFKNKNSLTVIREFLKRKSGKD